MKTLTEITAAKLAAARSVAEQFAERADVDSVYIAGSLLAGLGTSTSDVDLFVVLADTDIERSPVPEQLTAADGGRVDVELYTVSEIRNIVDAVAEYRVTNDDIAQLLLGEKVLDKAIRLYLRADVKVGAALEDARTRLDADDLRRICIANDAWEDRNVKEDIDGLVADGYLDDAMMRSADLLVFAANAFAAGCGELYRGKKWLLAKLRRGATEEQYRVVRDALFPDPGTPSWDVVAHRVRVAHHCLSAALIDGWDAPAAAQWPQWADTPGPRPNWDRLPWRQGTLLFDAGDGTFGLSIHERGQRVLRLYHGRPRDEVIDRFFQAEPDPAAAPSADDVVQYIAFLEDKGLLAAQA